MKFNGLADVNSRLFQDCKWSWVTVLVLLWVLVSALAYEQHIYRAGLFNVTNAIAMLAWPTLALVLPWRSASLGSGGVLFGLHLLIFLSPMFYLNEVEYGVRSAVYASLFLLFAGMGKALVRPLMVGLMWLGILIAAISTWILFFGEGFWDKIYLRNASFLFDPNYAAVILGLSALVAFFSFRSRWGFAWMLAALALTSSRGALLAFLLVFFLGLFLLVKDKKRLFWVVFLTLTLVGLVLFFNFDLLKYRPDLTAGRLPMWVAVMELSIHQPLTGLGFGGIKAFLMEGGFANRSTHNTFFDLVLSSGLLSAVTYCMLIAFALKKSWSQDRTLFLLIAYLFVASNFITFTMGGISLLSVVMFYLVVINITGSSAKLEQP